MALSLGGIMRGALPVATEYLMETPDADAQLINAVAEKYDNVGGETNKLISSAQNNIDTIEDMLDNDKRLSLIKDVLENNQRNIDYIKTTNIWFNTIGDKVVWNED